MRTLLVVLTLILAPSDLVSDPDTPLSELIVETVSSSHVTATVVTEVDEGAPVRLELEAAAGYVGTEQVLLRVDDGGGSLSVSGGAVTFELPANAARVFTTPGGTTP